METKICKKCGKVVAEPDAVYCGGCGARLDGKVQCPKCGKEMDEGNAFCVNCGARLVADGVLGETAAARTIKWDKDKILDYVSAAFAALLALVAVVFTFCIGLKSKTSGEGLATNATTFLYTYFGKAYSQAKQTFELLGAENVTAAAKFSYYFPLVLKTVASAATLIAAVAFGGLSAHAFYKKYVKKENVDIFKYPLAAFLSFMLGSIVLLSLSSGDMTVYIMNALSFAETKFNGATVTAFVLGFACIAGSVACSFVRDRELRAKVGQWLPSAALLVLATVCAFLTAHTVMAYSEDYVSVAAGFGFALQSALTNDPPTAFVLCSVIGMLAGICMLFVWIIIVSEQVKTLTGGTHRNRIPLQVVNIVLAALYLAMAVVANKKCIESMGLEQSAEGYGVTIVLLVFAVLALAVSVCGARLIGKAAAAVRSPAVANGAEQTCAEQTCVNEACAEQACADDGADGSAVARDTDGSEEK